MTGAQLICHFYRYPSIGSTELSFIYGLSIEGFTIYIAVVRILFIAYHRPPSAASSSSNRLNLGLLTVKIPSRPYKGSLLAVKLLPVSVSLLASRADFIHGHRTKLKKHTKHNVPSSTRFSHVNDAGHSLWPGRSAASFSSARALFLPSEKDENAMACFEEALSNKSWTAEYGKTNGPSSAVLGLSETQRAHIGGPLVVIVSTLQFWHSWFSF
ncbi:hypothetical protein SODALDRAFT_364257 [Sodiomyces alkalinus F11]|uniref:Uncharacterized protein n=1 Tax=Sodiomyces alkalinus (strain CBS 110278 / VKM F-3762 / F11) TaxID=1314773 RepID=A0A3N2PJP3_SODAK|nr:hypothetical protein SODALDRAFT_364257 [Sodiomyces alkalinus F11]ROT34747.1 hypothetical protein SODALDRAFT_364257 [Sodiomyces alkalinus F11]